jgi:hypothetical protein
MLSLIFCFLNQYHMTHHHTNYAPKTSEDVSLIYYTSGIIFALKYGQLFIWKHGTVLILKTKERKGKLVEKRGRKTTGLKLNS